MPYLKRNHMACWGIIFLARILIFISIPTPVQVHTYVVRRLPLSSHWKENAVCLAPGHRIQPPMACLENPPLSKTLGLWQTYRQSSAMGRNGTVRLAHLRVPAQRFI